MKIVSINSVTPVAFTGGNSYRALVAADGLGFSVNKTVIPKGGAHKWHYKNHLEACYCIQGIGELTNLETGEKVVIVPDTVYALDKNDPHTFKALEDTVLISVFNPPLTGYETHDKDGNYSISEDQLSKYHRAKELLEEINQCDESAAIKLIESILK